MEAPRGRPRWVDEPRYRATEDRGRPRDVAWARGPYGGRRGRPWSRVYRSPGRREGRRPTLTYAQKAALLGRWPACVAFGGARGERTHGPRAWWVPPKALEAWVRARTPPLLEGAPGSFLEGGSGADGGEEGRSDALDALDALGALAGPRGGVGGPGLSREEVGALKRRHHALAGRTAEVFVGLGVHRGFLPRIYRRGVLRWALMEADVDAALRRFAPRRHRGYRAAGRDLARFYRRRRGRYPWRFMTWGVKEAVNPVPDPLREERKVQRMLRWVWWRDTFMRGKVKHALAAQAPYLGRGRPARTASKASGEGLGPWGADRTDGPGEPDFRKEAEGRALAAVLAPLRPYRPPRPRGAARRDGSGPTGSGSDPKGPGSGPKGSGSGPKGPGTGQGNRPRPGQGWVSPRAWDALLKRHRAEGTFWDRSRRKKTPPR